MKSGEALNKIKNPAAAAIAGALLLAPLALQESRKGSESRGVTLEEIYKPAAIEIGKTVLTEATTASPESVSFDLKNRLASIALSGSDGRNTYSILVKMHLNKEGEPNPHTTFEVLEKLTSGTAQKTKENSIIWNLNDPNISKLFGNRGWSAMHTHYSSGSGEKGKTAETSVNTNAEDNRKIAGAAIIFAYKTAGLPASIPPVAAEKPLS